MMTNRQAALIAAAASYAGMNTREARSDCITATADKLLAWLEAEPVHNIGTWSPPPPFDKCDACGHGSGEHTLIMGYTADLPRQPVGLINHCNHRDGPNRCPCAGWTDPLAADDTQGG